MLCCALLAVRTAKAPIAPGVTVTFGASELGIMTRCAYPKKNRCLVPFLRQRQAQKHSARLLTLLDTQVRHVALRVPCFHHIRRRKVPLGLSLSREI